MRYFTARLIRNFRFICFVWLLLPGWGAGVSAQEGPVWNKQTLKDSVSALLSKYQTFHNQLNNQADQSVVRDFIHLFSNPKVQVINDIEVKLAAAKIGIEEYVVNVNELFPEGLSVTLDIARFTMDMPKYDRNNRYVIRIRINRLLNGIANGKVFSSNQKVIFQIAFRYLNNSAENFTFYGMDLPPKGQSFLSGNFSPLISGLVNSTVAGDTRLGLTNGSGYSAGLFYTYFFSDHWGLKTGGTFSHYTGSLNINKFDAFGGYDPNMKDIFIDNQLWFAEVPVLLTFRTRSTKRFDLRADFGLNTGVRVFENSVSTAINSNTGASMPNVITDTEWINQMTRFNLSLEGSLSMMFNLNHRLGILLGGGMRQGLTSLDNYLRTDFSGTRYLGQYNPLWASPGKTVSRAFFICFGATILLNREQN
jgi:hypothetical protein